MVTRKTGILLTILYVTFFARSDLFFLSLVCWLDFYTAKWGKTSVWLAWGRDLFRVTVKFSLLLVKWHHMVATFLFLCRSRILFCLRALLGTIFTFRFIVSSLIHSFVGIIWFGLTYAVQVVFYIFCLEYGNEMTCGDSGREISVAFAESQKYL